MLTTLGRLSLPYQCVFYRPENNVKQELNLEVLDMQKWNIQTDRAQKVDEKYGFIWLVIMFTPGLMTIKISKMAHLFLFSADASKKLVTGRKYLRASERSDLVLSENAMD